MGGSPALGGRPIVLCMPDPYHSEQLSWPGDRDLATDRGKSGLHRTPWWVTPTVCKDRDSATENKPPGCSNRQREVFW